jgi:hypothetical protein
LCNVDILTDELPNVVFYTMNNCASREQAGKQLIPGPTFPTFCAVKFNENNIQKAKAYTALALEHDPSLIDTFSTKVLLDHEVLLMQAFDCQLLIFSVHTELPTLLLDMKRIPALAKIVFEDKVGADGVPLLSSASWSVACDAHCCGACLLEPPFTVALACIIIGAKVLKVIAMLMPFLSIQRFTLYSTPPLTKIDPSFRCRSKLRSG